MRETTLTTKNSDEIVTVTDGKETFTCTRKAAESIYNERGFNIVTRDNAGDAPPANRARMPRNPQGQGTKPGSAAEIAETLNLDDTNKE